MPTVVLYTSLALLSPQHAGRLTFSRAWDARDYSTDRFPYRLAGGRSDVDATGLFMIEPSRWIMAVQRHSFWKARLCGAEVPVDGRRHFVVVGYSNYVEVLAEAFVFDEVLLAGKCPNRHSFLPSE